MCYTFTAISTFSVVTCSAITLLTMFNYFGFFLIFMIMDDVTAVAYFYVLNVFAVLFFLGSLISIFI